MSMSWKRESPERLRERAHAPYGMKGLYLLGLVCVTLTLLVLGVIGMGHGKVWGWLLFAFSTGALFAWTFLQPLDARHSTLSQNNRLALRGLILMGGLLIIMDVQN